MPTDDSEYLKNYTPDRLIVKAARQRQGSYVSILTENEELVGDFEVTPQRRFAVTHFYVSKKEDFSTFKIHKLKKQSGEWVSDGQLTFSKFDLDKMTQFMKIISTLDLSDGVSKKVSLGDISLEKLESLIKSSDILEKLENSPNLKSDIYAVTAKKNGA